MKPALKWALIIGGIILFIAILIGLYFLFRNPSAPAPDPSPDPDGNGNNGGVDCLTQSKYNIKKEECHKKCAAQLLIPFLGLGAYKLCNAKCVDKITPVCL